MVPYSEKAVNHVKLLYIFINVDQKKIHMTTTLIPSFHLMLLLRTSLKETLKSIKNHINLKKIFKSTIWSKDPSKIMN